MTEECAFCRLGHRVKPQTPAECAADYVRQECDRAAADIAAFAPIPDYNEGARRGFEEAERRLNRWVPLRTLLETQLLFERLRGLG